MKRLNGLENNSPGQKWSPYFYMNEKQVKLLRYFAKNTGQVQMAGVFKIGFDKLNHKKKGKLTKWLKYSTVIAMQMKETTKNIQKQANLDTLKGFTV